MANRPVPIKKRTKLTPTNEEKIKSLLVEREEVAARIASDKKVLEEINNDLFKIVETLNGAEETWEGEDYNGRYHRATIVRSNTTTYDEEGLEAALAPKTWEKITYRVLDVKKLEDAVVDGDVPAELVEDVRTISPRKPYIKVTTK